MSKFILKKARYFYKNQKIGFYITTIIAVSLFPFLVLYLIDNPQFIWKNSVLFAKCVLPILLILVIFIYSFFRQNFNIFTSFTSKRKLESGSSFLQRLDNLKSDYCLVIRPFGDDGGLIFDAEERRNPFASIKTMTKPEDIEDKDAPILLNLSENNPQYNSRMTNIHNIDGWILHLLTKNLSETKIPVSIEEVTAEAVKTFFEAETICLADPSMSIFPKSVKYIMTSEDNWRDVINIMLRKVLVTILIYQPETLIGQSTKWEIERIYKFGLIERFVILLPLPNSPNYLEAFNSLISLKEIQPYLKNIPKKIDKSPIAIWIEGNGLKLFFPENEINPTSKDYTQAILSAFETIKKNLEKDDYENLYPYWSKNLVKEFNEKIRHI